MYLDIQVGIKLTILQPILLTLKHKPFNLVWTLSSENTQHIRKLQCYHVASVSAFFLSFTRIKEYISKRHSDHHTLYGLSPVWILLCRTNWLGFWKHLWHVSHLWTKVLRSMFRLWLLCDSEAFTWNKQALVTDEHNAGHLT